MTAEGSKQGSRSSFALRLFVLGFLLMFVGVAVLVVAALLGGESNVSGGVVLIVWFIPVVVGFGPYSFYAILVSVVLSVVAFVVFVWLRKRTVARG